MPHSKQFLLPIAFLALVLLGAGCGRKTSKTAPAPKPASPVSEPTPAPATPAPPAQVAQVSCPITAEIVKEYCGLAKVTANPFQCVFDTESKSGYSYPVFIVVIKSFREFAPGLNKDSGTLGEVFEVRRVAMNSVVEGRAGGFMYGCDRIETKSVSGLGDEAFLAPGTLLGCDETRVLSISKLERSPWLWIRKGNIITEILSAQGDVDGNPGCSPDEILRIARDHVLPALSR